MKTLFIILSVIFLIYYLFWVIISEYAIIRVFFTVHLNCGNLEKLMKKIDVPDQYFRRWRKYRRFTYKPCVISTNAFTIPLVNKSIQGKGYAVLSDLFRYIWAGLILILCMLMKIISTEIAWMILGLLPFINHIVLATEGRRTLYSKSDYDLEDRMEIFHTALARLMYHTRFYQIGVRFGNNILQTILQARIKTIKKN
jgi:hypothetical protein